MAGGVARLGQRAGRRRNAEDGLVVHDGPDGLPHAFEIDASEHPDLVARALSALRQAKGFAA